MSRPKTRTVFPCADSLLVRKRSYLIATGFNKKLHAAEKNSFDEFIHSEIDLSKLNTSLVGTTVCNAFRQVTSEAAVETIFHVTRDKDSTKRLKDFVGNILFPQATSLRDRGILIDVPKLETRVRNRHNIVPYNVYDTPVTKVKKLMKVIEKFRRTARPRSSSIETKIMQRKSQPTKSRSRISNPETERPSVTVPTRPLTVHDETIDLAGLLDNER